MSDSSVRALSETLQVTLRESLVLNSVREIESITEAIRRQVREVLRRRGALIAVSGGIDSTVCAALCTHALGPDNVFTIALPERDSSSESSSLARKLADSLGVRHEVYNIEPVLRGAGCYEHQRDAIKKIFPEFTDEWKYKVVLPSILEENRLNVSRITVLKPNGESVTERLPVASYLQLIAATNFKQRTRTMMAYYDADRLNYAVCGTPNRLEYDQGFFVKQGDGAADFKPIAHLYKTQVFQLAEALGVPEEIRKRTPTTDTFSLPQTQEEFYFSLPYQLMDLCLYAHNHGISAAETAKEVGLTEPQVQRVFKDIEAKRRATLPLHLPPMLAREVREIKKLIDETNKG